MLRWHDVTSFFRYRFVKRLRDRWCIRPEGLTKGWHDADGIILHAGFHALGLYIEECGGWRDMLKWSAELRRPRPEAFDGEEELCRRQADNQEEAVWLWLWWRCVWPSYFEREEEEYAAYRARYGKFPPRPRDVQTSEARVAYRQMLDRVNALEQKRLDEEQVMLHRLIDVRFSLWT